MPVALDPNEKYSYVLSTDRACGEHAPTLVFHFPTCREQARIAELFDAAEKTQTVRESLTLRCDAVRMILVDWRNLVDRQGKPIAYDPETLEDVLSDNDLTELQARLLREMSMAEWDKKKSVLLSQSNSAPSAPGATADDAPKNPPPRKRLISSASPAAAKTQNAPAAAERASSD